MGRRSSPFKKKNSRSSKVAADGGNGGETTLSSANASANVIQPPTLDPSNTPSLSLDAGVDEPWSPTKSQIRSPTKPLDQQVTSLAAAKDAADEELWKARIDLQRLTTQAGSDAELINRLQTEVQRLRTEHESESQLLDELQSQKAELEATLSQAKSAASREKSSSLEKLESRDEFIEGLQAQLESLRAELATNAARSKTSTEQAGRSADYGTAGESDSTTLSLELEADETADQLFTTREGVTRTPGSSELLSNAHTLRQQRLMRSALQKMRVENAQLRHELAEARGTPVRGTEVDFESLDLDEPSLLKEDDTAEFNETISSINSGPSSGQPGEFPHEIDASAGVPLSEDFVDKDTIERDAHKIGLAVIPIEELHELRFHSPTVEMQQEEHLRARYDSRAVDLENVENTVAGPGHDSLATPSPHHLDAISEENETNEEPGEGEVSSAFASQILKPGGSELGIRELRKIAAQRDHMVMSTSDFRELLHGSKRSRPSVQSHVLADLAQTYAFELAAERRSVSPSRSPGHRRSSSASSSVGSDSVYTNTQSATQALDEIAKHNGLTVVRNSVAGVKEYAARHSLVAVPLAQISELHNSKIVHNATLGPHLDADDGVLLHLSKGDADMLQQRLSVQASNDSNTRRSQSPSVRDLASSAAALGMAVMPLERFEKLQGELHQLQSQQTPDAAELAELADRAGLRVIPKNPTLDELSQVTSEDVALVERSVLDALEHPDPATLTRLAKPHGLVVLLRQEVDQLRSTTATPSKRQVEHTDPDSSSTGQALEPNLSLASTDDLREVARQRDMVLLSAEEMRVLSTKNFSHLPMSQRTEHFEKLIKSAQESRSSTTSPRSSPSSLGSLSDRIQRLGFVPVEQGEYQRLIQSQKIYEPSRSDVIRSAKGYGLATMPMDEYSKLRNTHWSSPQRNQAGSQISLGSPGATRTGSVGSIDEEDFEGLKAVPAPYLDALRRIVEHPTRSDVDAQAEKLGLQVSRPLSDEEILQKGRSLGLVDPLSIEEILSRATDLGWAPKLTDADILSRAKDLGLTEPTNNDSILSQARTLGLVDPPSDSEYLERAKSLGLSEPLSEDALRAKGKSLGLSEPMDDKTLLARAKSMGLIEPLSDENVIAKAKELGLVEPLDDDALLTKARSLGLTEPLSDNEIIARAKALGLVEPINEDTLRAKADALGLVEPPSDRDVLTKAKSLGLVEPLGADEIVKQARSLGLVDPPNDREIHEKARTLGLSEPLSDQEILQKAKALGLMEPLNDQDLLRRAEELGLVSPLADDDIREKAKRLGLVDPPSQSDVLENAKSFGLIEPLSAQEIVKQAKSLGLVEPLSDQQVVEKFESLGYAKPLTDAQVLAKAKHLGLVERPDDQAIVGKARKLGLVDPNDVKAVEALASKHGFARPLSNADISREAQKLGMIHRLNDGQIKAKAKNLGLVEPLTDGAIKERAKALGLTPPLGDKDIIAQGKKLGLREPLSDTQIKTKAEALGMVENPTDAEIRVRAKRLGLAPPPTKSETIRLAKSYGLVEPISDAKTDSSVQTKPVEANHELDAVTKGYHHSTSEAPSLGAAASMRPRAFSGTSDAPSLPPKVRQSPALHPPFEAQRPPKSPGKVSITGLPEVWNTSPERPTTRRYEVHNLRAPRGHSPRKANIPRSSTVPALRPPRQPVVPDTAVATPDTDEESAFPDIGDLPLPQIHEGHVGRRRAGTGLSASTMSSLSALSPEEIEVALNQMVAGEVLYKYYSSSLEGVTGGRHRRFFWFRPAQCSLYWHRENPNLFSNLLGAPAKMVTVVSIEEVLDRNPIPAGLYHRSIVVRGVERDLQLTCPTAARHRAWVAGLRHAVANREAQQQL